jgi:hypothetical protein
VPRRARADGPTRRGSKLYLSGANDLRGEGEGFSGLASLVVKQPEFARCAVQRNFERIMKRPVLGTDRAAIDALTARFEQNGRQFTWLLRELLSSDDFRELGEGSR